MLRVHSSVSFTFGGKLVDEKKTNMNSNIFWTNAQICLILNLFKGHIRQPNNKLSLPLDDLKEKYTKEVIVSIDRREIFWDKGQIIKKHYL